MKSWCYLYLYIFKKIDIGKTRICGMLIRWDKFQVQKREYWIGVMVCGTHWNRRSTIYLENKTATDFKKYFFRKSQTFLSAHFPGVHLFFYTEKNLNIATYWLQQHNWTQATTIGRGNFYFMQEDFYNCTLQNFLHRNRKNFFRNFQEMLCASWKLEEGLSWTRNYFECQSIFCVPELKFIKYFY